MLKCKTCNAKLVGNQTKFCSNSCTGKFSNNKYQNYAEQQRRSIERKVMFIKQMGGKCEKCDYNKNIAALCFHHLDPSCKKFALDFSNISNRSIKSLQAEADKCQILCHHCHAETHYTDEKFLTKNF